MNPWFEDYCCTIDAVPDLHCRPSHPPYINPEDLYQIVGQESEDLQACYSDNTRNAHLGSYQFDSTMERARHECQATNMD